jgi:hypothetical protein
VARHKRTAERQGAWLVFEVESGQGLRPRKGRTWGRRGRTPLVTVAGGRNSRVSLAALIAVKAGQRPRLAFPSATAAPGAGTSARASPRPATPGSWTPRTSSPLVLVWDNLNTHLSRAMRELAAARDWLTVFQLPAYASELNPVESVWSNLKRSLANLAKRDIAQLTALIKTRLRRMQYQRGLLEGFLAGTRLDLTPLCNPHS